MKYEFTEDDLDSCWQAYKTYLLEILNGTYSVEEARADLIGLIGSKYDERVKALNLESNENNIN